LGWRQWWELDSDHDFLVSKNDLLRYGNHSLTYRIVERIFTQARAGPSQRRTAATRCVPVPTLPCHTSDHKRTRGRDRRRAGCLLSATKQGCACSLRRAIAFVRAVSRRRGAQAARPFVSKVEGKMGYEDFVWFILSEEDKTNDVSLEYWFRCARARARARTRTHAQCLKST